ncbi:UDP-glucuronic acid decarboxylase family protein [Amycolatopsis suaedae]|uniref:SDR family oxidoreductase n=1 Tax=Amycolatopsis suaedae TaxID=2510978 RepID=A0A4Q7J0H8_9PSEU|nr:UDP-glucuronic acid decarboxylase family protein [Amycolatopsis suaedae]RZQ60228.1 SDR family oxidoreductase [Amycolatopsis suaedae]
MRTVVTGGAGFVGSHLCERLLRSGDRVVCVDNLVTGSRDNLEAFDGHPAFEFVEADVTEGVPVRGPVDRVLHLACPASPRHYLGMPTRTLLTGSLGTQHALELAMRHGARFLLASTSEVYGDPLVHPQPETYWGNVNPIGPRSVYDEAKRYAEAWTSACRREFGADTVIARIFNTYGPRMRADDGRMIPAFVGQALAGEPLTVHGDGTQTRSVCYVDDTVRGLIALAGSDLAGPVNIGNPQELPVRQLAGEILELTGSTARLTYVEAAEDDPRRRCPDIEVARTRLGWRPLVGLREGLARTVDWFAARTAPALAD